METRLLIEIPSSSFINFLHLTSRNAALFFGMSGELAFLHLHIWRMEIMLKLNKVGAASGYTWNYGALIHGQK